MLYEDITKAPYVQLFDAGTTARQLWNAVVTLRAIEVELREIQTSRSRKEQLIAIHGNRFISHLVFQKLRNGSKELPDPSAIGPRIRDLTGDMLAFAIKLVGEQHSGVDFDSRAEPDSSTVRPARRPAAVGFLCWLTAV